MLASSFALLAAALNFVAVGASPIDARQGLDPISCPNDPLIIGKLVSLGPTGIPRKASFQGAKDGQGRLELSTSLNGTPSPDNAQFRFRACHSLVVPSTVGAGGENSTVYYGQLSPNGHPNKCVSIENFQSFPAPLVSDVCQTADTKSLVFQWWSFTTSDVGAPKNGTLRFVGHRNQTGVQDVFFGITNTYDATSNARLVGISNNDTLYSRTGFSLSLQA